MSNNDQTSHDPSSNDTSNVCQTVKTISSRNVELPDSPVPKPRRISPATTPPLPKKPPAVSPPLPKRPPAISPPLPKRPPAISPPLPRKPPVPLPTVPQKPPTVSPPLPKKPSPPLTPEKFKPHEVKVTPPESPIRRRSENFKGPDCRPKPPVRRRKKKFSSEDNTKSSQDGTNRNSTDVGSIRSSISEDFVTVDPSCAVIEREEMDMEGGAKAERTDIEQGKHCTDDIIERKKEAAEVTSGREEGKSERGRFGSFVIVEREEGRMSGVTSPIVSLPEERVFSREDPGMSTGWTSPDKNLLRMSVASLSSSTPDISQFGTEVTERSPSAPRRIRSGLVGSMSFAHSGKKKPPPLPPPPYHTRPPPVPVKQRSLQHYPTTSGITELTTPISKATNTPATPRTLTSSINTKQLLLTPKSPTRPRSPLRRRKSAPNTALYGHPSVPISREVKSPGSSSGGSLTPMNSVEIRVLTSRPETMPKHLSYGSSDSLELSGNSINSRHSTLGVTTETRRIKAKNRTLPSGKPHLKGTRPLSDASLNLLDTYDVVLPAGNLQDMMRSVISNDEKMQEATIYEVVQACMKAMPHITSTKDLPPEIPRMPTDTRSKVIHELYTTEYTYVHSLETLSEVFKDPLAAVLGDESGRIFANVDDILAFNKGFLALLHSRLSSWKPDNSCLGDLFIGMFTQSHRSMYAIYCSNYDSAETVLHQKRKKKEFEQQLSLCLQSPRVMPGLTLAAYLITPVQRVPRYILLLKDIIQRTADVHPDYKNLQTALEAMGELADYIDAQIRESQTKRTFDSLKNKVVGLADLDSPERSLVKEGQCFLKNIKKLYQCILFNDQLVFALGDSRQSKVQLQLPLEGVWVEDLEDLDPQTSNQDAIEVYTPDRPYTIYTQTSAEKKLWLSKLQETIYQLLLKDGKCTRSSNMDTIERTATFVYSDGRLYTGHYTCARRQGKGTMVWPDQSKYIGDWVDDERHGEGQFTFNTQEIYEGKWSEDRISGYGKMTFASGDKYVGYWRDGMRHGRGKIIYANGDLFEGSFSSGQIEGEGSLHCQNGLEYKGNWKHSQRHGQGRLTTVLGNTYEGEFSRNQIHGTGRMVYKNGDVYVGNWKGGMRHGHGKYTSKREGVYEGLWYNDLRHGKGRQQYPNKDAYDGSWELNLRHGKGVLEFATGEQYTGDFCYDMISGDGEMTYTDDCRYNGQWMNGLYHGQGIMVYHETSIVKSTFNGDWRHGLRHGQGELVMFDGSVYRGLWANDKPHGKGNYSVPSANYNYSGDWVEGKKEGKGTENSQLGLAYTGKWLHDQKHGTGEEKTLLGNTFTGNWERNRKHGRGVQKTVTGTVEQQVWRSGVLESDPLRKTAIQLPQLSRLDY